MNKREQKKFQRKLKSKWKKKETQVRMTAAKKIVAAAWGEKVANTSMYELARAFKILNTILKHFGPFTITSPMLEGVHVQPPKFTDIEKGKVITVSYAEEKVAEPNANTADNTAAVQST